MDLYQSLSSMSLSEPRLLNLPAEIRLKIYEYCLPEKILTFPSLIVEPRRYELRTEDGLPITLLAVNKQIRDEALPIYWQRVMFSPTRHIVDCDFVSPKELRRAMPLAGIVFDLDKTQIVRLALDVQQPDNGILEEFPSLKNIIFMSWCSQDLLETAWRSRKEQNKCHCLDCCLAWSARTLPHTSDNQNNLIGTMITLVKKYHVCLSVCERCYRLNLKDFDMSVTHVWLFRYGEDKMEEIRSFVNIHQHTFERKLRLSGSKLKKLVREGSCDEMEVKSIINNCSIKSMLALSKAFQIPKERLRSGNSHVLVGMCKNINRNM